MWIIVLVTELLLAYKISLQVFGKDVSLTDVYSWIFYFVCYMKHRVFPKLQLFMSLREGKKHNLLDSLDTIRPEEWN
jgi:hypothetical protein